jgi:hypothetical protein
MYSPSVVQILFHSDWFRGTRHQLLQNFEFKNYLNHYLKRSNHFLGTLKFLHTVSVSSSSVNKSFVRVRLYYLYLPMDVCTIFLHIFNKKFWLQFICNKGTNGRADGHQVFEQRVLKPHYTKRPNKQNVSKFSRNMFTEIRCEICINHFVEIIFTLSCAVVDINLLQMISKNTRWYIVH